MPAPRKYESPAQRQAAYRARLVAARDELLVSKGLPPLPRVPTMPGDRRWEAMIRMAFSLLQSAHTEMQEYFDERSESWCDSEKGEDFTERMDYLAELLDSFEGFGLSTQNTKENADAT
jgi:hypothetical protein